MSDNPMFDVTLAETISVYRDGKSRARYRVERKVRLPFAPRPGDIYYLDGIESQVNEIAYHIEAQEFVVDIFGQLCDSEAEVAESVALAIKQGWSIAYDSNAPSTPAPAPTTPQP